MIDIHNHVIYKFDDGPRTIEESLDMLRIAADQGITDVFATSHFNEIIPPEVESEYFNKLKILKKETASKGISVNLHSGAELFYHIFMDQTIKKKQAATLAGKGLYVLMEFSLFIMATGVEEVLFNLSMNGIIPIIAHPERYPSFRQHPQRALDCLKYGAIFQVNAGSVLGMFGKDTQKLSMWLLENKLVHFISSDAHNLKSRTFRMKKGVDFLKGHLDDDYISELVEQNAQKILNSEKIEKIKVPDLLPQENFFSRLKKKFRLPSRTYQA
jgi:protein-tyrosine phosphatase